MLFIYNIIIPALMYYDISTCARAPFCYFYFGEKSFPGPRTRAARRRSRRRNMSCMKYTNKRAPEG